MENFKVRVENGKIVGEAPPDLPEGTELELRVVDPDDEMTESELAELNDALERAWESVREGRVRAADDVIADVRSAASLARSPEERAR